MIPGRPVRIRPTQAQFWRRRLVAGLILVAVVALVVFGAREVGAGGSSGATKTKAAHQPILPPPPNEPGGGRTLFPSHRLVAFYGTPGLPTLGVLGNAPPEQLWSQLASAAAPYARPGTTLVPSYELIAYAAEASPGSTGDYSLRLPDAQIDAYLKVVRAHGGMLILDIQPGLSNLLADAKTLAPWLRQPDVGLALDPEWELSAGQRPGRVIGHTTGGEINQISGWLAQLTTAGRLPEKLLLIHQFNRAMVEDKPAIAAQPNLALTFNMDGFGKPTNKASVYSLLAADPRWHLGYKLFYQRDVSLQAPSDVLGLTPPPDVVEYG
ncbi:MAG: hypothetical protein M3063_13970 [Actinomycetota bacterium]|nr:hypothetical protein [Actinomycetota bacterium]